MVAGSGPPFSTYQRFIRPLLLEAYMSYPAIVWSGEVELNHHLCLGSALYLSYPRILLVEDFHPQ